MLSYVTKLTLTPAQMTQSDVQELRGAGFSDRDVLDIVEVTAYYAYANRVADGLGIPSESWIADRSPWELRAVFADHTSV